MRKTSCRPRDSIVLDVPFRYQQGNHWCVAACAQMLCDYYSIAVSQKKLREAIGVADDGCAMFAPAGTVFLRLGFEVRYVGLLDTMPVKFMRLHPAERLGAVRRWCRRKVSDNDEKPYLRQFIGEGGDFEPRFVSVGDITASLKAGVPVIAGLNASVFWPTPIDEMYHAVVIHGAAAGHFLVNDPYRAHGGDHAWPIEDMMYAMNLCEASALFVRRPLIVPP